MAGEDFPMAGEDFPMAGEDFPMAGEDFGQPASPQPIEIHWIFLIFLDFASNPTASERAPPFLTKK